VPSGNDRSRRRSAEASTDSRATGDILADVAYEVRTDVYEGPFDVLLRLITEQRVELYDVRLSDIVDGFLGEIDKLEHLDLEMATEFLLIAAILLELKSRRLLPERDGTIGEEDLAFLEERDYLLARLVECTTFSAVGRRLAELATQASRSFPRMTGADERFEPMAPDLLAGITTDALRQAAERALAERPQPTIEVEHVLVDEVTVAEVVERLIAVLPTSTPVTFRELTRHAAARIEIVVHFLGLLELYKQGLVELEQVVTFGDLVVTWVGDDEGGSVGELVGATAARRSLRDEYGEMEYGDMEYRG
jgi:segregation and condensation protein A